MSLTEDMNGYRILLGVPGSCEEASMGRICLSADDNMTQSTCQKIKWAVCKGESPCVQPWVLQILQAYNGILSQPIHTYFTCLLHTMKRESLAKMTAPLFNSTSKDLGGVED
eukprot:scaffold66388_cov52-Attheya_sp.AAC.2